MGLYGTGVGSMFWRTPKRDIFPVNMSNRPIWVSCWSKGPALGGVGQGLGLFADVTTNKAVAGCYIGGSNELNAFDYSDGSIVASAYGSSVTAGKWQLIVGQFYSTARRDIYIDTLVNADLSNLTPPQTLNSFQIGMVPNDGCLNATRLIAEVTFGKGILTTSQLAALQSGQNPLAVAAPQILAYFPLRGDLSDVGPLRTGLTRVNNATTIFGEHPPVAPPPKRFSLAHRVAVIPPATVRPRITMVSL